MSDKVYMPSHYTQDIESVELIECIEYIKGILSEEEFKGFLKGNIIKYLYRANEKNGDEDRLKADNYANYLITGKWK